MSIAFSCEQCGKHYEVSQALAGKRGRCKQCGHKMTIPRPAPVKAGGGPVGLDAYGLEEVAEPSRSRSRSRSSQPAPATGPVDPYSLDEEPEPLAPLPPAVRRPSAAGAESPVPAGPKKKKK